MALAHRTGGGAKGGSPVAGKTAQDGGGCCQALRRLCGLTTFLSMTLIVAISWSTVYSGWLHPIGLRAHSHAELLLFLAEVFLLFWSYFSTVLWGPGFVPRGWRPTSEEVESRLGSSTMLPLASKPPLQDLLQYCDACECYKPPRAHHCSECGRCVLWMDHHCPWTGTCVGHDNMQAFVLFVHYVPLASLHSLIIHAEVPLRLGLLWFSSSSSRRRQQQQQQQLPPFLQSELQFWSFLFRAQVLLALLLGFAALLAMLLVGSLAWNLRWSVNNNMTMVEELIMEKADARRADQREVQFTFPYDLGQKRNWEEMMGKGRLSRLLPQKPESEAYWPPLREEAGHFDLSIEQLTQKAEKLSRSWAMEVTRSFDGGEGEWCCLFWPRVLRLYGCRAACCPAACGERRLSVEVGEWVLASRREGAWVQARALLHGPEGLPGKRRGWMPSRCFASEECQKRYELPKQRLLQGVWEILPPATMAAPSEGAESQDLGTGAEAAGTAAGVRKVRVLGALARVSFARVPFALRVEESGRTSLLGVQLSEVDGKTAKWANGEVWQRPAADPVSSMGATAVGLKVRQRRFGAPAPGSAGATANASVGSTRHGESAPGSSNRDIEDEKKEKLS